MMSVQPIKALKDNYIWIYTEGSEAVVIDPAEVDVVLSYLKEHELRLTKILLTHDHHDHTDGVLGLVKVYPNIPVIGPEETSEFNTETIQQGESVTIFGEEAEVILTAGHTPGHISYVLGDKLFCGDALFSAGCGRVFTGDYKAQFEALQLFSQLPDRTQVYAGHEYTQTNLEFAQSVQGYPQEVDDALDEARLLTSQGIPTLPTTIGREKKVNLFLRANTLDEFKELRDKRDEF